LSEKTTGFGQKSARFGQKSERFGQKSEACGFFGRNARNHLVGETKEKSVFLWLSAHFFVPLHT